MERTVYEGFHNICFITFTKTNGEYNVQKIHSVIKKRDAIRQLKCIA